MHKTNIQSHMQKQKQILPSAILKAHCKFHAVKEIKQLKNDKSVELLVGKIPLSVGLSLHYHSKWQVKVPAACNCSADSLALPGSTA